ncbi:amino acid ABC transporter permease [Vagococcus xieshaowenii]|uniref:Amino acid ABC transporter permease n=1 Tax=Vagococcus xieshaowenii TaxID=2562451 RepID=A0AAJ5EE50_9ENTE|nr:amino acid ABC transporter permease [Vagococcus xieshaowenii]QCA29065.1 amino acid ABC transporter permease [Vagococcus xieshaowenii]TFZ40959.1 amino acid ABC transporter permease [Vagococcus xieshaowenii]
MDIALKVLPSLLDATKMTLEVFFMTLLLSLPLGLVLGLLLKTKIKWLNYLLNSLIWIIRGTPLLLQMIFVFYGFPLLGFIIENRVAAVLLAFVINYAAYFAEIFRGGIQAIPKGQYEAAQVLGLTKLETLKKIIMPQVIKIVYPSIGNEIITLVKDTSLVYALGLSELMKAGRIAMQREVSIIPLIDVAIIYLILTGVMTLILKYCEKKINYYQ